MKRKKKKQNGLIALLAIGATAAFGAAALMDKPASEPKRDPLAWHVPGAQYNAEVRAANAAWQHDVDVLTFTLAVNENQRRAWFEEAARAEAAEAAAAAAVRSAPARPTQPRTASAPRGGGSVGGACGGATNGADRYIGRESGGDPNARNPSGAWGCYQIMPGTWNSSCSDLGSHGSASTQAQAACASRLPHSSWAASGDVG